MILFWPKRPTAFKHIFTNTAAILLKMCRESALLSPKMWHTNNLSTSSEKYELGVLRF